MNWPRRGSMQFWPRVRASRELPRIRNWVETLHPKVLGFVAYKAGMTHIMYRDNDARSLTKGMTVRIPVTILECPKVKVYGVRFYKKTSDGNKVAGEFIGSLHDKGLPKRKPQKEFNGEYDSIRLIVATHPGATSVGKKITDLFEVGLGGKKEEQLELAKKLIDKEINIAEVFQEGQNVDVHGITKGKGFQGTVKRFGVSLRQHKSEKVKRGVGTLGAWTPGRVAYTVAQPGKMGYHQRTEYNKRIIKIEQDLQKINQKGGIVHYGILKNPCILIQGGIAGPVKRAVILTEAMRLHDQKLKPVEILSISQSSKQ